MTKIILILLIIPFICNCMESQDVSSEIRRELNDSENNEILFSFSKYSDNVTDSLIFIPPYTRTLLLQRRLRIDFSILKNIDTEKRDDICVLCVINKSKVIKYYIFCVYKFDLSQLPQYKIYPMNYLFKAYKGNGETIIILEK